MHEYDQIAEWFASVRSAEVGIAEVTALARTLTPGARVLDLGCGDGDPISRFLLGEGFEVLGLDSSSEMIARYRTSFPSTPARCQRVQDASFEPGSFHAVVAWSVLFHLSVADQTAAITRIARWLTPRGKLLFTSSDSEETAEGVMNGVVFRYVSLGAGRYRELLEDVGMRLVDEHLDPSENYVYLAEKVA